jgi:glycerol-3-phosphate dehydrogenase
MTKSLELRLKIRNWNYLKGKAIINATGVFTNAIMKLNDTVYKKILSQVKEFTCI